jgi:hypothetical protein
VEGQTALFTWQELMHAAFNVQFSELTVWDRRRVCKDPAQTSTMMQGTVFVTLVFLFPIPAELVLVSACSCHRWPATPPVWLLPVALCTQARLHRPPTQQQLQEKEFQGAFSSSQTSGASSRPKQRQVAASLQHCMP